MNDDELGFASYFTNQTYNDTNKYSYNPITTNDNCCSILYQILPCLVTIVTQLAGIDMSSDDLVGIVLSFIFRKLTFSYRDQSPASKLI